MREGCVKVLDKGLISNWANRELQIKHLLVFECKKGCPQALKSTFMERIAISSSSLKSIGYDRKSQILGIEFMRGGIYQYQDVPPETYVNLMQSESKGRFYLRSIDHKFRFIRINS
jgi:hypothetical protein